MKAFRIKWDEFWFKGYVEEEGVDRQKWTTDKDEAKVYTSLGEVHKEARELGLPVVIVTGRK